jgi:rhodanese-related sulfurtransferase
MGIFRKAARRLANKAFGRSTSAHASPAPNPAPIEEEEEEDYAGDQFAQMECGAQELKERLEAGEDVVLVDVRENHEVKSGLLPDAVHIPMGQLPARWEELTEANEVVCYCAAGVRSYDTAAFLRTKGLFNATSLEGGISAWRAIGGETPLP